MFIETANRKKRITTIKRMGDIVRISSVIPTAINKIGYGRKYIEKCSVNTSKLENNIARAKSTVRELVLCNDWNFFCTFTIDKSKYDRHDFKKYYADLSKFIANYNRFCSPKESVQYILVPEMHKDGAWHIHGVLKGIRQQDLYINKYGYLGWKQYEKKFGFISFSKIRDICACGSYITKYITKDSSTNISELGLHIYYSSNGLKKGEILASGYYNLNCPWDYITPDDFCRIKEFDTRIEQYEKYIEEIK